MASPPVATAVGQGGPTRATIAALRRPRLWLLVALVTLLANAVFLALNLAGTTVSPARMAERVAQAFAAGDLTDADYHHFDSRLGHHHYADCSILQMLVNDGQTALARATGPLHYHRDVEPEDLCRLLREIVETGGPPEPHLVDIYVRLWHGYLPVAALLLNHFELGPLRTGLKTAGYLALGLLLAAGHVRRRLMPVVACLGAALLTFWAMPYFSQSLGHAPGELFLLLGLAGAVLLCSRPVEPRTLLPFCAVYGAGIAYFEYFIGLLPTAAGFLFPLIYLGVVTGPDGDQRRPCAWFLAAAGWAAFLVGAAATVALNQLLGLVFADPEALRVFWSQLLHWAGAPDSRTSAASFGVLDLARQLFRSGVTLTWGSRPLAVAFWLALAVGWLAALWLTRGRSGPAAWSDLCAIATGSLAVLGWLVLFANHTMVHAYLNVRMFIVPFALGWAATLWQYQAIRARLVPAAAPPLHG